MYEIRTRHNNISQSKEIKGRGESSMIVTIAVFALYNSDNCRKKKKKKGGRVKSSMIAAIIFLGSTQEIAI